MSQPDNSCYGPWQDKVRETSGSILLLTIQITGLRAFLSSSKHLSNGCSVNIADAVTAVNIELASKMYNSDQILVTIVFTLLLPGTVCQGWVRASLWFTPTGSVTWA